MTPCFQAFIEIGHNFRDRVNKLHPQANKSLIFSEDESRKNRQICC